MHIIDDKPEVWPYILASLLLHALVLVFFPWSMVSAPDFKEQPIEVFAVSPAQNAANQYRIADIAEPAVQKKPKSAKFMGLYDSDVPEEMVGIDRRQGEGAKAGKPAAKRAPSKPAREARQSGGRDKLFAFNKEIFDEKRPAGEEGNAAKNSGGSFDDFYPDFRRGPNTYLNVLRYPEVEYFVRMKRAFKVAFNPEPSIRDYFSRNLVTRGSIDVVLGVSVNRSGELAELFVFRGSGVRTYDEEALRTVRASSPFSTPPDKFLSDDGMLRMTWTFSVYL